MLKIENLTKYYKNNLAVDKVKIELKKGDFDLLISKKVVSLRSLTIKRKLNLKEIELWQ